MTAEEKLRTKSKSAKSVTVLMDPFTNRKLIKLIHRPPIWRRPPPNPTQKWSTGVHSKMNTMVDVVPNARTKAPQALMMRRKETIGKMRYWKKMLVGTEGSQTSCLQDEGRSDGRGIRQCLHRQLHAGHAKRVHYFESIEMFEEGH